MLVDLLTLSYRLMVLYLGEPRVHSVMEEYWQHTLPEPYAGREAARFAQYVRDQRLPVPHLDEVLAYEVASMDAVARSEEHTSELQSLMRNSYAVYCLKKKTEMTVM